MERMLDKAVDGLNEAQRRAVTHAAGPLLIIAGAGTGKTTTLAHRVAWLVAEGMDPGKVLLLTFTRRAAAEMLSRVDGILRRTGAELSGGRVWGGTFHASAARLLRLHGRAVGLDPAFTILDRADSEDLMDLVRTDLGLSTNAQRFPQKGTCLDIYCRSVDTRVGLDKVLEDAFPWCREHGEALAALFSAYVDTKEAQGVLDYDDLLVFWNALMADEAVGAQIRSRFEAVLVDEYQDTNALQADILEYLCPDGCGLTVVGDDAQAIYSFRAATVRNILDFATRYPASTIVTLERNYRSTQPILDATNHIIELSVERHPKELTTERNGGSRPVLARCDDEDAQTEYVIRQVLGHREGGLQLRRQAVLFRASHHSMNLELELSRRNIPYKKYGGLKFIETAHVKDLMAILRLAENPRDQVAAARILQLLPGIGPKTARRLASTLDEAGGRFEVLRDAEVPEAAAGPWAKLVELMVDLAGAPVADPSPQVHAARTWLAPFVEQRFVDSAARLNDLEQLEWLASRFPDRAHLLAEIALDPPAWAEDFAGPPYLDEDYLILSTMHSAKGLEWGAVYVIHASDGSMPSDLATGKPDEIEEERRLFYVALTRAKDWLYVCYPTRYYKRPLPAYSDPWGYSHVSRFLPESAQAFFEHEVEGSPAVPGEGDPDGRAATTTTADIRAGVKNMWAQ